MKNIRKTSLLITAFFSLLSVCIISFSFYTYNEAVSLFKQQYNNQQKLILQQTVLSVQKIFNSLVREVEILAESPDIIHLDIDKSRKQLEKVYSHVKNLHVNDIAILNKDGKVVLPLMAPHLTGTDFSFRNYFKRAKDTVPKKPIYQFIDFKGVNKGSKGILLAYPLLKANNEFNGVILITIKIAEFISLISPKQIGTSDFWVIEQNGTILFHSLYKPGTHVGSFSNIDDAFKKFISDILTGNKFQTEYQLDGVKKLASAVPVVVADQDWLLILDTPVKEVKKLIKIFNIYYTLAFSFPIIAITICSLIIYNLMRLSNLSAQREITTQKKNKEITKKHNTFLNNVIESLPHPFYVIDASNYSIIIANSALARNNSWIGKNCYEVAYSRNNPCSGVNNPCPVREVKKTKKSIVIEHLHYKQDGSKKYVEVHCCPVFDKDNQITQVTEYFIDITKRKQMEKRLHEMSITDDLTKVYNRRGFLAQARKMLKIAERTKSCVLLLYVDLDNLKIINDSLGHELGDKALLETVAIFHKTFRESDIIGRLGGDEFVILMTEETDSESKRSALSRLDKIIITTNEQNNRVYDLSMSVGTAYCSYQNIYSIEKMLSLADKSMYEQKALKKQ